MLPVAFTLMDMQRHMCYDDQMWLWLPNQGWITSLNIRMAVSSRSVFVQLLTLLCVMLIKSFLSNHVTLIISEYVEPNVQFDISYDQTVKLYIKIRTTPSGSLEEKYHKSTIILLRRCPQPDVLPTGTTATFYQMAACQVIIHHCLCLCRCNRSHFASRDWRAMTPTFYLSW